MARGSAGNPELAKTSNKLMWWRVRLQMLTLGLLLIQIEASQHKTQGRGSGFMKHFGHRQ